ncbi:MAG: ABC transporter permease [Bacteroidota bacterium]
MKYTFIEKAGSYLIAEFQRILKDPGAVLIFIIAVIAYPVIYSIAYQNETLKNTPVAVADLSKTKQSRTFCKMLDETDEVSIKLNASSLQEAKNAFFADEVNGILLIEKDFEESIYTKKPAVIKAYADGSYFLYYKQVISALNYSGGTLSAGIELQRSMAEGKHPEQARSQFEPISLKVQELHNPFGGYGSFVMPGLILIILQQTLLVGLGMMGGTFSEQQLQWTQSPGNSETTNIATAVVGRAGAYILLYLITGFIVLFGVHHLFSFPDNANILQIMMLYLPFIMAVTFLGLAISTLFRRREEAFLFLVFISPLVMFLSGISWPPEAIPDTINKIGNIFPSNFMVPAYLRLRTMGAADSDIRPEMVALLMQCVIYFGVALVAIKRKLKKTENQPKNL